MLYTTGMFGMRVLVFLLGIALVVWILMRLAKAPRLTKKTEQKIDDMVRCARCGVFTPRQDAIQDEDRYFCGTCHRDQDQS